MERPGRLRSRGTFGAMAVAALLSFGPGTALARPLPPADMSGWELRGNLRGSIATFEDHVWIFHAGGRVTGNFSAQITWSLSHRDGTRYIEGSDTGRWKVEGGQLCVQWAHWYRARTMCWTMHRLEGRWVRLQATRGGAPSFKATLARR